MGHLEGLPSWNTYATSVKNSKTDQGLGKGRRREGGNMEEQYVNNPTPETFRAWADEQQIYSTLMIRKAQNKQLFQRQKTFVEGERVGQMLAHLVKTNSPSIYGSHD